MKKTNNLILPIQSTTFAFETKFTETRQFKSLICLTEMNTSIQ